MYTIDLLGEAGKSVQQRPIENDADKAAWLNETLRELPETKFHVIGISIGGWTAANLAAHHPDHVASLTLVDPVVVFADMPLETVIRSIPASVAWLPKAGRDNFASWTAGGAPVEDVPVAVMIESAMQIVQPALSRIPQERLAGLDIPVLAIFAGKSVMHDAKAAAYVAGQTLKGGTVELFPGASHAINGEYPEQLANAIRRHLDAIDKPAREQ